MNKIPIILTKKRSKQILFLFYPSIIYILWYIGLFGLGDIIQFENKVIQFLTLIAYFIGGPIMLLLAYYIQPLQVLFFVYKFLKRKSIFYISYFIFFTFYLLFFLFYFLFYFVMETP